MSVLNRLVRIGYRARGHYTAKLHGETFHCDADHMSFWKKAASGTWEPQTFEILARFLTPSTVYCDLGAWIGPTVMYAARKCRLAYCFEPDSIAYEYLLANLRLNKLRNVVPFNLAVASTDGLRRLASQGKSLGNSASSLLPTSAEKDSLLVPCLAWSTLQNSFGLEKIDVFKIDIEGGEFELLPSLAPYFAKHRPIVYLSTHAPYLPEADRAAAMKKIAAVLADYKNCFDENLKSISREALTAPAALNDFQSFVFQP